MMRSFALIPACLLVLAAVGCGDDTAGTSDSSSSGQATEPGPGTSTGDFVPTTGDPGDDTTSGTTGPGLCESDADCRSAPS